MTKIINGVLNDYLPKIIGGLKMKIVCFGGGNGIPKALLPGLKKQDAEITTVTSMADNGGSTGQLRKDFNVLPPGDIRRHLISLSQAPQWKKDLFAFRFGHEEFDGGHKGHSFGNIFIAGLEYVLKDYEKALVIVHEFLEIKGQCLPATVGKTQVCAELENGEVVEGEDEIDVPKKHEASLKIKKIFLKPEVDAYKPALDAIDAAEMILIGPGDLYSSLLPCFLPEKMAEHVKKSAAKKIFICPAMTKIGETDNFSIEKFADEVEKYIGCGLDAVIYNCGKPEKNRIDEYKKDEPSAGEPLTGNKDGKFVGVDILAESGGIVYDTDKLVKAIMGLK